MELNTWDVLRGRLVDHLVPLALIAAPLGHDGVHVVGDPGVDRLILGIPHPPEIPFKVLQHEEP